MMDFPTMAKCWTTPSGGGTSGWTPGLLNRKKDGGVHIAAAQSIGMPSSVLIAVLP